MFASFEPYRGYINNVEDDDAPISVFKTPPHSILSPALTQVCTTPSQFSMWLKNINGEPNSTLHHGLCPPKNPNGPFWGSNRASKYESDIWKNTMRIATEAILSAKTFKKRTKQIYVYHYTSGMGSFYGMKKSHAAIEGKKIDRSDCLELWKERK